MEIALGKKGLANTWQTPFEAEIKCPYCEAKARIAFVAQEIRNEKEYIASLRLNMLAEGGSFWPHDVIAVAIYFCTKCAKAVAEYNQA